MSERFERFDECPTAEIPLETMSEVTRQGHARARHLGARDGGMRAVVAPKECDPKGGFRRRLDLDEDDRDVYIRAYCEAFFRVTRR